MQSKAHQIIKIQKREKVAVRNRLESLINLVESDNIKLSKKLIVKELKEILGQMR